MAQSSGVTSRKDQSTGQFGLRLRRVLILFEDVDAGISRLCAIAENLADTAVLLEPVRARAPNRRRLQSSFHERASRISSRLRSTDLPPKLPTSRTSFLSLHSSVSPLQFPLNSRLTQRSRWWRRRRRRRRRRICIFLILNRCFFHACNMLRLPARRVQIWNSFQHVNGNLMLFVASQFALQTITISF